ncbi:MAG: hypothetical protein P1Q69_02225 [Candidatus Thorarchaeota archaeon]|nr:hypothetical protein [Candidatus Thorarchaeota archaeon]
MQTDVATLMIANLYFAIQWTPPILVVVTVLRGLLLLKGQKREFEDWFRNPLMTFLSVLFLPGTLIYTGIRYAVSRIAGIKIDRVSGSTTYGELNVFIEVEKPPRVSVLLVALYANVVLSVFVALTLLVLPFVMILDLAWTAICLYVAVGVFYNSSLRSGDAGLVVSSLRRHPRSGSIELAVVIAGFAFLYWQLMGVVL